ncbi:hypothetical protein NRB56_53600 [Nocardia sp. RB56]|uniref:Uncharacterized protein n=1 Tax=Nocardia aurantia TaxID=2585199 RepID=A0A7K0DW78_9NOCA|nr:hypothetical protein [Nocardia aurantia]MQY29767.1 hypothetical protein [Nocardia aurantia]
MTDRAAADSSREEPTARRESGSGTKGGRDSARLARIFGETLPQTTSDERGHDGEPPASSDDWLRSQVPPHHGGH